MDPSLRPLQAGIGTIANAVLHGLIDSPFRDMTMYSEVLQDSAIELLDSGQLSMASASSITLSAAMHEKFIPILRSTASASCCARRKSATIRKWCAGSASSR
jgi:acyl-CoA hydrolase